VAAWLEGRGIAHAILRWEGEKPSAAIQARARAARHDILTQWCQAAGVLHLLLAHHRDDQLETALLRSARDSGPDGLAAMAPIVERASLRILRPLLPLPSARLRATLRALGQGWIDDPSNRNEVFTRVRIRADLARYTATEIDKLGNATAARARTRRQVEADVARLLAASAAVYPEGWARVDVTAWRRDARDVARRALMRLILAIGGGLYQPRGDRLDRLLQAVLDDALAGGRTLGGCRFVPYRGGILVLREPAAAAERLAVGGPGTYVWDGRFAVAVAGRGPWTPGRLVLTRLDDESWRTIAAAEPGVRARPIPAMVRHSLPTLLDLEGVRSVPHLMYGRRGADPDSVTIVSAMFRPRYALAGPGFAVI
jgi:tRNA(Ile)-lysidine synthase